MSAASSPSNQQLSELDVRAQAYMVPEVAEHNPHTFLTRPHTFLALAPQTSSSYPKRPVAAAPTTQVADASLTEPNLAAAAATAASTASAEDPAVHKRRSSSISSASDGGKSPARFRFLKLGPVHYGVHPDEHQEDWHNATVVE